MNLNQTRNLKISLKNVIYILIFYFSPFPVFSESQTKSTDQQKVIPFIQANSEIQTEQILPNQTASVGTKESPKRVDQKKEVGVFSGVIIAILIHKVISIFTAPDINSL